MTKMRFFFEDFGLFASTQIINRGQFLLLNLPTNVHFLFFVRMSKLKQCDFICLNQ